MDSVRLSGRISGRRLVPWRSGASARSCLNDDIGVSRRWDSKPWFPAAAGAPAHDTAQMRLPRWKCVSDEMHLEQHERTMDYTPLSASMIVGLENRTSWFRCLGMCPFLVQQLKPGRLVAPPCPPPFCSRNPIWLRFVPSVRERAPTPSGCHADLT